MREETARQQISALLRTENDERVEAISNRTFEWWTRTVDSDCVVLSTNTAIRLSVVASAYAAACAPTFASERSNDIVARLVLVFLSIDDSVEHTISSSVPFQRWCDDFIELHNSPDKDLLFRSFDNYLRARECEPVGQPVSIAAHWASRRHTIFVEPFVVARAIAHGVRLGPLGNWFEPCVENAAYAAFISNDLGSRDRDLENDTISDLNIIDTYRRVYSWPEEVAHQHAITQYNDIIAQMRELFTRMTSEDSDATHVTDFVDIISACVDGNVRAMHSLPFRYSNVIKIDQQLERLRG